MSLRTESAGPQNNALRQTEGDIVIPPVESASNHHSSATDRVPQRTRRWNSPLAVVAIASGLLLGGLGPWTSGSDESQHPHWQYVQAASDAATPSSNPLTKVADGKTSAASASIEVTMADANRGVTEQIRSALLRNDFAAANRAFQAAQSIAASADSDAVLPDLESDPDLASALEQGRKELFQIELFDCCQEDGDVVEVFVNGSPFATVPIINAGTLLSMPLSPGENTITIQGTQDGRGGVTLSFRTSRGDFFARRMRVGQAYHLGVTVQ